MSKELWKRAYFSCDSKKVFGGKNCLTMTPEELDDACREAGVVWEDCGEGTIHVHGCGIICYCHGGVENKNLRPRPEGEVHGA